MLQRDAGLSLLHKRLIKMALKQWAEWDGHGFWRIGT